MKEVHGVWDAREDNASGRFAEVTVLDGDACIYLRIGTSVSDRVAYLDLEQAAMLHAQITAAINRSRPRE